MSATNVSAFTVRIQNILSIAMGDVTAAKLIDNMRFAIARYHDTVNTMSRTLQAQRFRLEGEELRDLTQRLDRNRHTAHECLIDSVIIANRYFFKKYGSEVPAGGVYTNSPMHLSMKDRNAIGEWALQVAPALK